MGYGCDGGQRQSAARRAGRGARRAGGFSFVELVIVLAIVAVMAAMAMPRYGNAVARQRLDATTRRIAADLNYAQMLARTTSASKTVQFDAANNSYQFVGVADPDRPEKTYLVDLSGEPYRTQLLAPSFQGAAQITFDAYGQGDKGGVIPIKCGDMQKTVTVDAATGKVTIQ